MTNAEEPPNAQNRGVAGAASRPRYCGKAYKKIVFSPVALAPKDEQQSASAAQGQPSSSSSAASEPTASSSIPTSAARHHVAATEGTAGAGTQRVQREQERAH
eukprot:3829997-Rhodomonas_salina.1